MRHVFQHLPMEIRDKIGLYVDDFLIAFALHCSETILTKLSLCYFKKYNVLELVNLEEYEELQTLYKVQDRYGTLNCKILVLFMRYHENCSKTWLNIPTFPYANNLHCLQLLYHNGFEVDYATFVMCARYGSVDCMAYLQSHFKAKPSKQCPSLLDMALMSDNVPMIQYLIKEIPCSNYSMGYAAKNGNFTIMQSLYDLHCPLTPFSIQMALEHGNVFHCRYLRHLKCPIDENVFNEAAKCGKVCLLRCLQSTECPISDNVLDYAVYGTIESIDYLLNLGCDFTPITFKIAASIGNLEMMQYIYNRGCPFSKGTFREAVIYGDLINLKWLNLIQCPIDQYSFSSAVLHNNCELLDWLFSKAKLNPYTFEKAAAYSNLQVIKWLLAHECPYDLQSLLESAETNKTVGVYLYIKSVMNKLN